MTKGWKNESERHSLSAKGIRSVKPKMKVNGRRSNKSTRQSILKCPRCGKDVIKSDNPEYVYQCMDCDEDFYSFEVVEGFGFKTKKERDETIKSEVI